MVGDQIDRDVEFSKIAPGTQPCTSPGGSIQYGHDRQVTPDYVITNFEQIMPIMGVADCRFPAESSSLNQSGRE